MTTPYDALLEVAKRASKTFPPLAADEQDDDYFTRLATAVSTTSKDSFDAMPLASQDWFDRIAEAISAGTPLPVPEGYDRAAALERPKRPGLTRPSQSAPPQPQAEPPQEAEPRRGETVSPPAHSAEIHTLPSAQEHTGHTGFVPEEPHQPEPQHAEPPQQAEPAEPQQPSRSEKRRSRARSNGSGKTASAAPSRKTAEPKQAKPEPADTAPVPSANSVAGISRVVTQWLIEDPSLTVSALVVRLEKEHHHKVQNKSTLQSTRYNVLKTMEIAQQMGWRPPA